jgi:PKD repeat protein
MVSGAAAILEAQFAQESYRQIKQRMLSSVDAEPTLQGKCVSGGRLNLYQALVGSGPPPTLPFITLQATEPDAYASGSVPGVIRFHRTGDTSQAYEVYWTFSGTASNGVDYQQLPTHSPFPAGQADADLTITPIDRGPGQGDKTVVVTLAPGADYQAGNPDSATVTIHGATATPVTAAFSANPSSGQAPLTVQFTDQSSGPVSSWSWTFGDGSTSTTQSPSHTYASSGTFTATLTVSGSSGQTSSASHTLTVSAPPPPPSSTVTVVASQPLATSLTPGEFTISRQGDTSSTLTVTYSLGGTAANGVDYQTLPGVATFPAGSSSARVTVQPLGLLAVLKTVVLTISPDPSYNTGSPNSATVQIVVSL